jgi:hypothetical protein
VGCIKGLYFDDNNIITILSEGIVVSHDEAFIPEYFGADHEIVQLALEAQNIEARPMWPPARLRPVGDYAPEGRAHASERSRCTCNLCFRLRSRAQSAKRKAKVQGTGGGRGDSGRFIQPGTLSPRWDSDEGERFQSEKAN